MANASTLQKLTDRFIWYASYLLLVLLKLCRDSCWLGLYNKIFRINSSVIGLRSVGSREVVESNMTSINDA